MIFVGFLPFFVSIPHSGSADPSITSDPIPEVPELEGKLHLPGIDAILVFAR